MKDANQSGLFASLRQVTATALEMAQVRLELLGTELEFEKRRLFDGILIAAVAMVFLGVGLVLLSALIIIQFWDDYRLTTITSLSVFFLCLGVFCVVQSKKRLKNPLGIFCTSAAELKIDRSNVQTFNSSE